MDRPLDLTVDLDPLTARKTDEHSSRILAEMSDNRTPHCILCGKLAASWVRGVAFPFGENKMLEYGPDDFPGPLPGLCLYHEREGSEQLAGGIFFTYAEVQMMRPTEWVVSFTDGTKIRGHILSAVPEDLKIEVQEAYAPKEDRAPQ
jgi:hypothetical protein